MANLKSSEKDTRRTKKRTEANRSAKSKVRTYMKKAEESLLKAANLQDAMKEIVSFESVAMKAARKNIVNKFAMSRKVSRLVVKAKLKFGINEGAAA